MELKIFIFSNNRGYDIAESAGFDADDAARRLWGKGIAELPGIFVRVRA